MSIMTRPGQTADLANRRAIRAMMERRQQRYKRLRRAILLIAVPILLIGIFVAVLVTLKQRSAMPGESFSIQGRQHIPVSSSHPAYNSVPPTSGWHYGDQVAPWGVATASVPNEVQVHNLEHGGIVIQYRDSSDAALIGQLTALAKSYPTKILLAPYPEMPYRVALTAWGRRERFDAFDDAAMRTFVAAHIDQGPEKVP